MTLAKTIETNFTIISTNLLTKGDLEENFSFHKQSGLQMEKQLQNTHSILLILNRTCIVGLKVSTLQVAHSINGLELFKHVTQD